MKWLWWVGPIVTVILFFLTGRLDKRRLDAVDRWRKGFGWRKTHEGDYRSPGKKDPAPGAKQIGAVPAPFLRLLNAAGGGTLIGHYELCSKLAYLSSYGANAMNASDHCTVTAKLEEAAPSFTARPLPIVEGNRIENTGVEFKKDPEFMALFLVERLVEGEPASDQPGVDKAVRKWLSPPIRAALLELPAAWLRVTGKTMALTIYGPFDDAKIKELVAAADVIFAEHGAEGGPSLLGDEDEDEEEAPRKAVAAKA